MFPLTFDTKVLANRSCYFSKTVLNEVYTKCTQDKRLIHVNHYKFDIPNKFEKYSQLRGSEMAHEAAFDAYMTGYCFGKIARHAELDAIFKQQREEERKATKDGKKKEPEGGNFLTEYG